MGTTGHVGAVVVLGVGRRRSDGGPADRLALAGPGGHTVWDHGTDAWLRVAFTTADRNLTREELTADGPRNAPSRATCEQWPIEG